MKKLALDESNHPVLAFLCFLLSYCIMYVFNTKYKSNIELILRSILLENRFLKYKGAGMNDERFYVGGSK